MEDIHISELIQPFDLSAFSPNSFKVIITKMPETLFYIQSITIPGITVSPTLQRTTGMNIVPYPGETMEIDDIAINFIVNENLSNYLEIHQWIRDACFTSERIKEDFFTNIILFTLTNNKNPCKVITFRQCFPYALGALELNVTEDPTQGFIAGVQFKLGHMIIDGKEFFS